MENKAYKRKLEGVVCSSKSDKTIVVSVVRRYKHPKYSKFVNFSKKYHAHDSANKYNVGDTVTIIESKAYSKLKKWEVL
ncbi:MAG: 30S ribosomal protein S17 [Halobacteriovoraceae bacterium]|nr:30S ribosomal protein S17 [Halobacteriovoraceae bacterium]|tara:strand:+ start:1626 stop:1862 length:237 start_codon:yes stop_codon:yes gene_type:complete